MPVCDTYPLCGQSSLARFAPFPVSPFLTVCVGMFALVEGLAEDLRFERGTASGATGKGKQRRLQSSQGS